MYNVCRHCKEENCCRVCDCDNLQNRGGQTTKTRDGMHAGRIARNILESYQNITSESAIGIQSNFCAAIIAASALFSKPHASSVRQAMRAANRRERGRQHLKRLQPAGSRKILPLIGLATPDDLPALACVEKAAAWRCLRRHGRLPRPIGGT
jgi:hypothetical protein